MKDNATALGIDVGGTNLRIAEIDASGCILSRHIEPVTQGREAFTARLTELIERARTANTCAVGVGIPGRVDPAGGRVLSAGYLELEGLPLSERLQSSVRLPTVVENDCTMALIAECAIGVAKGCSSAVMFTIGTGIGGAVVLNGIPLHGRVSAGQLGHITVQQGGKLCNCGRYGCVETTSSGTALGVHIREAGLPASTDVAVLLAAAEAGDASAIKLLTSWSGPLRDAATSMVASIDPELVVIGGGLGWAMVRALKLLPPQNSWYECEVAVAQLGDDAGVIGAGLRALSSTSKR